MERTGILGVSRVEQGSRFVWTAITHGACNKKTQHSLWDGEACRVAASALSGYALVVGAGGDDHQTRAQDLRKVIE